MITSLLARRLLIPYMLLLIVTVAAVLSFALWRELIDGNAVVPPRDPVATIWFASAMSLLSIVIALGFARRYRREQSRALAEAFNLSMGRSSPPMQCEGALEQVIDALASSTRSAIHQASRDQAHLMAIMASMSDGLIATDREQLVLLVNRAAQQMLVMAPEPLGKRLWEASDNPQLLRTVTHVMLTGQPKSAVTDLIDGRYLELTAHRLTGTEHRGGVIVMIHDVTEATRYQEMRKEFVANVSHELRTPLSVVKGYVETLRDGALQDPTQGEKCLATIEKHTDQLINLVSDLLDLTRLEQAGSAPARQRIALEPLVRRAADLMHAAAHNKGQTLEIDVQPNLPMVTGDAGALERVVANLLDNAVKYTPPGGSICMRLAENDGKVDLEVSDTGLGIPPQDVSRIFERFYRVDRSRSREMGGTGLGLSIVKHVVQAHGGAVSVISEPGKGSRFTVSLPSAADEVGENHTDRTAR